MSRHSKWSTIKRQKAAADAKRSSVFTKLANAISLAARDGSDPTINFKLRMAIEKAKAFSIPKENIERAITRGSGTGRGGGLETVTYEGFGPSGIAIIVEAVTNNRNRTAAAVKHVFSQHGGNLAGSGSVAWMFNQRGIISIRETTLAEEQELALIDAGMVDTESDNENLAIITPLEDLQAVERVAREAGLTVLEASSGYVAKEKGQPENVEQLTALLEALDDLDEVSTIYTNAAI